MTGAEKLLRVARQELEQESPAGSNRVKYNGVLQAGRCRRDSALVLRVSLVVFSGGRICTSFTAEVRTLLLVGRWPAGQRNETDVSFHKTIDPVILVISAVFRNGHQHIGVVERGEWGGSLVTIEGTGAGSDANGGGAAADAGAARYTAGAFRPKCGGHYATSRHSGAGGG